MNILYIIGNGFDINLGIKTKYSDFYEFYQSIKNESENILNLKKSISNNIENWSDLELAFGKYTSQLQSIEEFDEVFDDIIDNLCDYLSNEEKKFDFSKVSKEDFIEFLINPENHLPQEDKDEILLQKSQSLSEHWNINIMTFNYTRTIERIMEVDIHNRVPIGLNNRHSIFLNKIQHIHGYTDERTILGVNDVSQISKSDFHKNEDILEALVKTKTNRALRHTVDKICEKNIAEAELICVFGSSLGDTDNYWWKLIGENLRNGGQLIIFKKGESIKQRFGYKTLRSKNSILKLFLDKTDLKEEERKEVQKVIHIGVNTKMFDLIK